MLSVLFLGLISPRKSKKSKTGPKTELAEKVQESELLKENLYDAEIDFVKQEKLERQKLWMVENKRNSTKKFYNFSAGPGCLPQSVLAQARDEIMDY